MKNSTSSFFKRPTFSLRTSETQVSISNGNDEISTLYDLIRFNARENPNRVFAYQSEVNQDDPDDTTRKKFDATKITFSELDQLVLHCATWIRKDLSSSETDQHFDLSQPIALYMESGIGLFLHFAALLYMKIPVLLLSARLSSASVLHLLKETGARTILLTKRTQSSLSKDVCTQFNTVKAVPYHSLMESSSYPLVNAPYHTHDGDQKTSNSNKTLILHSSGTTGLPKPIYLTQRYLLGYAACHQFPPDDHIDWVNLSTLPLYHGFGLLAPCLSLSVGMTFCLPPTSIVPASQSTLELLSFFRCRSLMTVPSIVDDIISLHDDGQRNTMGLLAQLEFVAVGGGALRSQSGSKLIQHNVKLLNHYGVTEIGAIAPIFRPGPDYNWRYLRLRSDIGLELRPIANSARFRLVGSRYGYDEPFEIQDELELNPESNKLEVRILGRVDDVIVLKTGEKVQPQQLENTLNADSAIKSAVCVGNGFFELVVIIELNVEDVDNAIIQDYVWNLLSTINPSLDHHARITSKTAVIIKPPGILIPRTDKGSISRREVHDVFKEEISAAYAALESESHREGFELDRVNLEAGIRKLIATIANNRFDAEIMDSTDDFFEGGMDSLQSVQLARLLGAALPKLQATESKGDVRIRADFIYQNPTIRGLVVAIARILGSEDQGELIAFHDRSAKIRAFASEFITRANAASEHGSKSSSTRCVILMTGSTGNLGAHTLAKLARNKHVNKIICLIRLHKSSGNSGGKLTVDDSQVGKNLLHRQVCALEAAGIHLQQPEWNKISLFDWTSFNKIINTNDTSQLPFSVQEISHILHLAWPMDFRRTLESFEPHIEFVRTLVNLARYSYRLKQEKVPVRLLFASSIAVVRYYEAICGLGGSNGARVSIPETAVQDPLVSVPMGYAEAKWVCEIYLDQIRDRFPGELEPVVVRIGQLSGPEGTAGTWNTEEHIPILIKASQKVGTFPSLKGNISWLPVDRAAQSLVEILAHKGQVGPFLHLENPIRQPMEDIFAFMGHEMQLPVTNTMPFEQWIEKAAELGMIHSLKDFYIDHFRDLACGSVDLDTVKCRAISKVLYGSGGLSRDLIIEYVRRWRSDNFLE